MPDDDSEPGLPRPLQAALPRDYSVRVASNDYLVAPP